MKPKYAGPLATFAVFALVGGAWASSEGYIDPSPVFDAVGGVLGPAVASLGLTAHDGVALFIGIPFVVGGAHNLYKGLPAFPTAARVLLTNPDVGAGEVHQTSGAVELQGTAQPLESAGTTASRYSGTECLAHRYRHRERRRQHTTQGPSSSSWVTVEEGEEGYPFLLVDETGEIPVIAQEADVSLEFTHVIPEGDAKKKEGVLEPGDEVYVYGQKKAGSGHPEAPPDASVYVGPGDEAGDFVVSDASETRTGLRYSAKGLVQTVTGLGLIAGGLALMYFTGTLHQLASALP